MGIHLLIASTGILLFVYAMLIFYYHHAWDQIPESQHINDSGAERNKNSSSCLPVQPIGDAYPFPIKVSVIIPARNEARRIGDCLDALHVQTYPKEFTEIIVVNDFSTDDTTLLVMDHPLLCTLINLSDHISGVINSYKKKAIETGISHSSGELIICTDADCRMQPDWIRILVNAYEKENLKFIAAPVKIISNGSWLSIFQILDFISLQGITGAAVYKNLYPMCNGANLAYPRTAYQEVGGFSNIDHIASGDDMLLMKKIQSKFPGKIRYAKNRDAIVETSPAENIKTFLNQRIRWASKISHYKHPLTFITLALVYAVNLSLLILFLVCFFHGHWRWLLMLVTFKIISEYFFVSKVAVFFRQESLMKYFPICQPFHILYTVIAGSFGSFGKYEWKNRKVK